jgi:hypothetical protein
MDPKYVILIFAIAIVMGWFAFGMIFNLRRGDKLLHWLRGGLPTIGEKTTFRWLGSSVAEMVINKAKKPFRNMITLLVFAPRDVPWMWAWARLNGRRDTIIFRADLSVAPRVDLEFADPGSWTGRLILGQLVARGWEARPFDGMQLMAPRGMLDYAAKTLEQLAPTSQGLANHYWRLSIRRQSPHLELHIPQPDPNQIEADRYFEALRKLAQSIAE